MLGEQVRRFFPSLHGRSVFVVDNPLVKRCETDNGASSQLSRPVIQAFLDAAVTYANIDRGFYDASRISDRHCKSALNIAANFTNAPDYANIVLTSNTTTGLDLVELGIEDLVIDGDNIVITALEHSSNGGPWIGLRDKLAQRLDPVNVEIRIADADLEIGELDYDSVARLVDDRTILVSCTAASNFFGTKPDLAKVAEIAKASGYVQEDASRGSLFMGDGAQFTPSNPVDVQAMGVDFYAFPGHKMGVPMGIGGLYGTKAAMDLLRKVFHGGGMYEFLTPDGEQWRGHPWDFIPGTPNILGAAAFGAGMQFLVNIGLGNQYLEPALEADEVVERAGRLLTVEKLMMTPRGDFPYDFKVPANLKTAWSEYQRKHPGVRNYFRSNRRMSKAREYVVEAMTNVRDHLRELTQATLDGLAEIDGVTIYGPMDATLRTPLVSFNIAGMTSEQVGQQLSKYGVENRANHHCAYFAHQRLGIDGSARVSYWVQNNMNDVQRVVGAVQNIAKQAR